MPKKIGVLLLCFVVLLSGCSSSNKTAYKEEPEEELTEYQEEFNDFLKDQLVETLESDYYTLHSYLKDPETYDIDSASVEKTFGRMDAVSMEEDRKEIQKTLDQLQAFDYEQLTDQQQDTYDIFTYNMECSKELSDPKFDYIASAFSPMTGIHVSFPTIFADWTFDSEQELKDLILMIQDVDDYTQSAIDYTYTQNEKGYLCLDFDSILSYYEKILDKGLESSVLKGLQDQVDALDLDSDQTKAYKQELEQAFSDSYLQAYELIKAAMLDLKPNGNNHPNGLASFDVGKEYYSLLMKNNTGSDMEVIEVEDLMDTACKEHLQTFIENADSDMSFLFTSTNYTSYEQMLDDIQDQMFDDFPKVESLEYEIKDMEEDVASDNGVAAYFQIPEIDGDLKGQLRVNPNNNNMKAIDTYMTVAHEGMPGHMYQYNYAQEHISEPLRWSILASSAYQEGYATYAQHYSLRYLKGIKPKQLKAYSEYMLVIYDALVLADIGIHYYNWDQEKCQKEIEENYGITIDEKQYNQLLYTPCAFEPYYTGYEQIMDLKERAKNTLKSDYNEKEFHTILLNCGPAPFFIVEENMAKAWKA
ncbi:DUF885 domain-containing protein [Faecalicoccus pleomorphus]|uniref:DUF885 domain-containing protein n=1 Tax=Faecalicoccus pleomorphus TaxID=1323 RepID=A0AAW6CT01_9FIRM|nr:DUF885 domain-containing protein [Faecalicoccus pleomorphus]MDB7980527.1 DUF885 domain-containing protein [Faecalicoccus pleomorphus]MDB7982733.1 DUF885 domain-containing protein [Faecalicoccus pleomorphus]